LRYLVYALVLVSSLLQTAIAPLLPSYAHRFQLGGVQTAALLAATGIAALAVSVPAGALADRLGARGLTLWAGALLALSSAAQAFAPSYTLLLGSRLIFGLGYGMVWTAALAWLANASRDESALAGTVTVSGLGSIAGPAFAGFIAQYFGLAAPFVVASVVMVALTAMLAAVHVEGTTSVARTSLFASLRAAAGDARVLGATTAVIVAGASSGISTLLVPLELHAAGASEGSIGLVFSAAAVLFIIGSAATGRVGQRAVRLKTVLAAALVLAFAISPATVSTAPLFVVLMLCATTATRSVLWTVGYPLGATGANQSGLGLGVVMGLLNGTWALTAVVSPLVAGALVGPLGARATFGITQVALAGGLMVGWLAFRAWRPVGHVRIGNA
jgi:MFS family permease